MPGHPIPVVHRRNMSKKRMEEDVPVKRSSCSNFYISPTIGETVNALDPLPITWDPTCLSDPAIDIYLYSPGAALPRIHVWEGIALSSGTYNATLMPRWWNSTSSQSLQITIVVAGQAPFLSTLPVGPVFTATYTPPASGTPPSADTSQVSSGITQVNNLANSKNALTPGKKAAAALLTLLFFIGLGIAAYIKFKRMKGKQSRKRWTEAVDKRMSTISTDWKSVSVAGANAAIRNSMAVGNRSSAFSFGAIRPSSTYAVENEDEKPRPVSQMRTGVGLRNNPLTPSDRVSRVSFAPDTRISRASTTDPRPSGESRRTRAFHTGYVPPVPSLPDTADPDISDSGSLSPRQSQGPLTLTPEDIRARIAANKRSRSVTPSEISNPGNDIDEVMPALRMMRTGNDPSLPDDFLLNSPEPIHVATPTSPIPQHTTSPIMPMEPIPANVMSPDEMLRQYAERKKSMTTGTRLTSSSSSLSSINSVNNYPKAVVKKRSIRASLKGAGSNTMRVLYNATRNLSPTSPTDSPTITHRTISSVWEGPVHGEVDDDDDQLAGSPYEETENGSENNMAGMGTANSHPFGYHPNAYTGYAIEDEEDDVVDDENAGQGAVHFGHAS